MNRFSLCFSIDYFVFHRAQPPEIVPKTATTNIFGTRTEDEEQQQQEEVDIFPPG